MNITGQRSDDGFVYVRCPKKDCGTGLKIKPKSAQTSAACASCGTKFSLQVTDMGSGPGKPVPPPPPPNSGKNAYSLDDKDREIEKPRPKSKAAKQCWEVDDEARRKARRNRRDESKSVPFGLIVGGGIAALLLVGAIVFGAIYVLKDKEPTKPADTPLASNSMKPSAAAPVIPETLPRVKATDEPKSAPAIRPRPKKNEPMPSVPEEKLNPVPDPETNPTPVSPKKNPKPETPVAGAKEILDRVKKSTALIEAKGGWGTGFVIRPGIVMTNAHVISGRMIDDFRVSFVSLDDTAPPPLKVTLLYSDKRRDLAILRVDADRPPLEMTSSGTDLSGMQVAVVGNPKGDAGQAEINKVTTGTLSAPIRRDAGWTYFELAAQAYFGNSGGPVVDLKTGKLVGVMQSILGDGKLKSYCIPYGEAVRALDTLPGKEFEQTATRIALARHYLDFVAERLPEVEDNADFAMQARLATLRNRGQDVAITVRYADGRVAQMTLAGLITELKEKHTTTFNNLQKAMAAVSSSSEIPGPLKAVMRERVLTCDSMRNWANASTNMETTFVKEMTARRAANDTKAKSFTAAYQKFLDDLERKPIGN